MSESNAGKILYLSDAAFDYLEHFMKNKLENDVYTKLEDASIMANLKADGLRFLQVYADLTTLAKSRELYNSAVNMNIHYLELNGFIEYIYGRKAIKALDKSVR